MHTARNPESAAAAARMLHVINELREIDQEMAVSAMAVLFQISITPGISMRDLEERLSLGQSTVSRAVAALSQFHRAGKPGYDLVVAYEDPTNRRSKLVALTDKGKRTVRKLLSLIEGRAAPEVAA